MKALDLGIPTQLTTRLQSFKNSGRLTEYEHQTKFQTVKIFSHDSCKLLACPAGRYYLIPHPGGAVYFEGSVVEFTGLELTGFFMESISYHFKSQHQRCTRLMLSHSAVDPLSMLQRIHNSHDITIFHRCAHVPLSRRDVAIHLPVFRQFSPADLV